MAQISDLTLQNEQLAQKLSDAEHQNRLALTEAQHKLNEAKITADDLTHAKATLTEKIKVLELSKARLIEEAEAQLIKTRGTHDNELQEREE